MEVSADRHMVGLPVDRVPGAVVDVDWLLDHLGEPDVVVVDASIGAFRGHAPSIVGSRPFDIDGELSDHTVDLPHTMPPLEVVSAQLRALGLRNTDHIVAYDAQGVYSSPRALWMLRALGHASVSVLNGGLPAWRAADGPLSLTSARYAGPPGDLEPRPAPRSFVTRNEVVAALSGSDDAVLDARSRLRFLGIEPEPREGLRSGHMPGSVNVPFTSVLADGKLLPADQLRAVFGAAVAAPSLITSCGSGVTACVVALAALVAGYDDVGVYDGSWSEWGRPGGGPVSCDEA